jgi:TolB-like protein
MKRVLLIALSLSFLLADTKTIAILDFDVNDGVPEGLIQLGTAIPIFLISDLSDIKSLDIVERKKIQALLDEINLGDSKFMDKSTAQQLGSGLGAELIMTGAISLLFNTISIDARIIHVGTGEVLMAKSVREEWDEKQWYNIYQKLPKLFVDNIEGVSLSRREQRSIEQPKPKTKSFDAALKYSKAIDANDKEDYSAAASLLESAIDIDPEFDLAYEALESVEEKLELLEKTRSSGLESKYLAMVERVSAGDKSVMNEATKLFTTMFASTAKIYYNDFFPQYIDDINSGKIDDGMKLIDDGAQLRKVSKNKEKLMISHQDSWKKAMIKGSATITTMKTVLDIANENGLINEKDQYNNTVDDNMYTIYVGTLGIISDFKNNYFGINNKYFNCDIFDANGKIIIYGDEINDVIIKEATMMMVKYPTGQYFGGFKYSVERMLEQKKTGSID